MLCLSGFELYYRWVPLKTLTRASSCLLFSFNPLCIFVQLNQPELHSVVITLPQPFLTDARFLGGFWIDLQQHSEEALSDHAA